MSDTQSEEMASGSNDVPKISVNGALARWREWCARRRWRVIAFSLLALLITARVAINVTLIRLYLVPPAMIFFGDKNQWLTRSLESIVPQLTIDSTSRGPVRWLKIVDAVGSIEENASRGNHAKHDARRTIAHP